MPGLDVIMKIIKQHRITPLELSDSEKERKIKSILSCFELNEEQISSLGNEFHDLLKKGLEYNGTSPFNMANTFVYEVLEGTESGTYLALDLGGTNFRVVLAELLDGKIVREEVNKYEVEEHIRLGSGTELFKFLAESLADFCTKHRILGKNIPLGFTFSFPTYQHSLDSASLQKWIGKYNATDVVHKDVVKLLNEQISKIPDLNVPVVAVLNDTIGVLIRGTLLDKETCVSLIFGTGSNVCYFEKTDSITGWIGKEKEAALNIEWGPFTDDGRDDIIKTKYDERVDKESLHPNLFTFEKYVGGEFFGKLLQAILEDFANQSLIFEGRLNEFMEKVGKFTSAHISDVEEDNLQFSTNKTKAILNELGMGSSSDDDVAVLKYICELISIRMALLASITLAEVIKRIDRNHVTVACDGSVYVHHPRMHKYITDFTNALVDTKVKLILAEDGSGVGAALIAALACKQKEKNSV